MTRFSRRSLFRGAAVGAAAVKLGAGTQVHLDKVRPLLPLVLAFQADSVVSGFGVRTDNKSPTNYPAYANLDAQEAAIINLGVRHLRESVQTRNTSQRNSLRTAMARFTATTLGGGQPSPRYCVGTGQINGNDGTVIAAFDEMATGLSPAWIDAVEGPNEPNGADVRLTGPTGVWYTDVRTRLRANKDQKAARPAFSHVTLLGPALVGNGFDGFNALGDITALVDGGNLHTYPGGLAPPAVGGGESDMVSKVSKHQTITNPGQPIYCTESGMHDATLDVNAQGEKKHTPRAVANVYLPRLTFSLFRLGVARHYYFELADRKAATEGLDSSNHHHGLYEEDWTPKPIAATAKRMLDLFRDYGASFTPAGLRYTVSGAPTDMHQRLYERRNGTKLLVLWRDVSIWNRVTQTDIAVTPVRATINLQTATPVSLYRPSLQTAPWKPRVTTATFTVNLGAELVVCEIGQLSTTTEG